MRKKSIKIQLSGVYGTFNSTFRLFPNTKKTDDRNFDKLVIQAKREIRESKLKELLGENSK